MKTCHPIVGMNLENMVLRKISQTQKEKRCIHRPPQERQDVESHRSGKQDGG